MTPQGQALPSGTLLDGRYELTRIASDGADDELYEGVDRVLERPVLLKVHRGTAPEARARFEREVHELATHDGPAGDRVFDAGTDGDIAYAVLEPREGEVTTQGMAVIPDPAAADGDLTQPISTDHTMELPVPPLLVEPEPAYVAPTAPRWTPRATRNAAIAAACLVGVGALVLAAERGPDAVETPTGPSSTVVGADADQSTQPRPTATTPTTAPPPTTTVAATEPTAATLFPPGFPFEDGGPRGKGKKD